jgi:hypothetical protein
MSAREHFPRPNAPKLTKETMFDFVVDGAQQNFPAKQNQPQQAPAQDQTSKS